MIVLNPVSYTHLMNCDHSLLTYSFYKQPRYILKLFQIRLREIVKINLLPALVIGAGLSILLYCSGGTEDPINYGILFVSILCMSVFFSVHYLVLDVYKRQVLRCNQRGFCECLEYLYSGSSAPGSAV